MTRGGSRLNVTLDEIHAAKLRRLAERLHVQEGTLARSLLAQALDETDADPRHVADVLDRIRVPSSAPTSAAGRQRPARRFRSTSSEPCHASRSPLQPELAGLPVLHYDRDFELIAEVTGQPMRVLAPLGSLSRG